MPHITRSHHRQITRMNYICIYKRYHNDLLWLLFEVWLFVFWLYPATSQACVCVCLVGRVSGFGSCFRLVFVFIYDRGVWVFAETNLCLFTKAKHMHHSTRLHGCQTDLARQSEGGWTAAAATCKKERKKMTMMRSLGSIRGVGRVIQPPSKSNKKEPNTHAMCGKLTKRKDRGGNNMYFNTTVHPEKEPRMKWWMKMNANNTKEGRKKSHASEADNHHPTSHSKARHRKEEDDLASPSSHHPTHARTRARGSAAGWPQPTGLPRRPVS